ncbi:hypothetical protein JVU11DRAFT_6138 [Chiua virens]|nr:hypothetical protein JVU11DRAFT_6138 [Chiua virens]
MVSSLHRMKGAAPAKLSLSIQVAPSAMDSEIVPNSQSRPTSPSPEFDVRAKIDEFSSLLSRTIICFYQFLASDKESEGPRRRLLDEYITVGGAANSTKILLDTNDERKAEGYLERRKKIESLWVPEGPLAMFAARMQSASDIMHKTIEDHKKIATYNNRRDAFPLSLERLNEEIRYIHEYKKLAADALYEDFYTSNKKVEPQIQLAMNIIEWLGFVDTTDRQEFMSRQRHEGTCKWIFNKDICKRYHEWWSATEGFLWIRGRAASGKSVILAAIVEQIFKELWEKIQEQEKQDGRKREHDEPPYVLPEFFPAFYFFDFRDLRTLKTSTFLKSLFVQFLQVPDPDLETTFPDLAQRYLDGSPPPADLESFQNLILHAMRAHEKKVIFVDGLNECEDVPAVIAFLERAMQEANVRILVASRPEPEIAAKYRGRPTINLDDYIGFTTLDMREWLMKRMMDHDRLSAIPELKKIGVLDVATECAQESFWHAQCIVDSLAICRSVAQVNEMLEEAPKDLETVHYNILRRVNERSEDVQLIVSMATRWLGGALRPLSLSQIIEAVQIELGHTPPLRLNDDLSVVTQNDMLMLCGNLIKIDDRLARLGLGHQTLRVKVIIIHMCAAISYMPCRFSSLNQAPEDEKLQRYFFDPHDIHRDLALRSITYIMTGDIEDAIERSYKSAYMFDISRRYAIVERCPMLTYVFEGGLEHLQYYTQEDDDAIELLILLQNHILRSRTSSGRFCKRYMIASRIRRALISGSWRRKSWLFMFSFDLVEVEGKDKLIRWAEKIGRFDHKDMLVEFELPELLEKMEVVSEGTEQEQVDMEDDMDNPQDVIMADE